MAWHLSSHRNIVSDNTNRINIVELLSIRRGNLAAIIFSAPDSECLMH